MTRQSPVPSTSSAQIGRVLRVSSVLILATMLVTAACSDGGTILTGAGATFPAPVYQAWFEDYNHSVASDVKINYQSIGSGAGVQQFHEETVDFGASDAALNDQQLTANPDAQHIPMVLGAVVVTYNLGGLQTTLKLDGDTIARIYLGEVKKWNDPAITALNPGVNLPNADIQVVYRSDGSGTTFVWTDYLSSVNATWKSKVGKTKNPNWPVGQGGKGNEGVTNAVRQTPNSIAYVELNYAMVNRLPFAEVKNRAGKFVQPSIESTSAAAAGVDIPADYRVSIVNAGGDTAYPIASFTYLLVFRSSASCSQQRALADFLWWVFHDPSASATAAELDYAPVPQALLPAIESTLKGLKCDGGKAYSLGAR